MGERFQLPIPLWRVQYQLLGGHRRMAVLCVIYLLIVTGGVFGFRRLYSDEPLITVSALMLNGLIGIQAFIIVLAGCNAVHRAMLRDYESKMIESHRLTPMSNIGVVLGYLFGSTVQVLVLFIANLAVGAVLTALAGLPLSAWINGNLLMLSGAVTLWSVVVLSGLQLRKPVGPVPVLIAAALFGNVGIMALPAAGLLLCAYPLVIGIQLVTGSAAIPPVGVWIIGSLNVLMTVFWLSTAAAKYRRPDLPALNGFRGLTLLAFWVVPGTAGIVVSSTGGVAAMRFPNNTFVILIQWVATMILSLVVALPMIAGAVECSMLIKRGSLARDWADRASATAWALIGTLLICGGMSAIGITIWRDPAGGAASFVWSNTALACLLALLTARAMFMLTFALAKRSVINGTILLILLWGLPLLIDLIRAQVNANASDTGIAFSSLLGFSPAGTLAATWIIGDVSILPGLWSQLAITFVLSVAAWRVTKRRWERETPRETSDVSPPPSQVVE